jgi:hypothetical protein
MINPNEVMGADNSPMVVNNTGLTKQVQLDADALRMRIDRLTGEKEVIIDGTSFSRINTITGTSYSASWDTLHLRILHTIAVQPNPNSTTMSVNDTLNLTSGIGRDFNLQMNGTNGEITSTDGISMTATSGLAFTANGGAIDLTTGSAVNFNGAIGDFGGGYITECRQLNGSSGTPLEITSPTNDIILTTNTNQDTTMDQEGNIKLTNKTGLNTTPVGSFYGTGVRGRQLQTTGGGSGYGDFITYSFVVGQLNDGRGHNLTRGMGLATGFEVFDWGVNPGFIQSWGCRMTATLPDTNTFICPFILADMPSGIPDINYSRITYYGNSFTDPSWVCEGAPSGVQCPAVQVNRFLGGSQVVIEWSCSLVYNDQPLNLQAPLNYSIKIIGVDSSQEVLRAEVKANWLDHPVPQATAFRPCIAFENVGASFQSIDSAEVWSNGCPFGL